LSWFRRHCFFPKLKAAAAQQFPVLQYEKYKLPNGLEVILHEDHRLPLGAVNSGITWAGK